MDCPEVYDGESSCEYRDGECDGNEVPDIQFTNLSPKECYQKC